MGVGADSAPVTKTPLPHSRMQGRVVVVAGHATGLAGLATSLVEAGALVAYVAPTDALPVAQASVRADPADPSVWERIAPHVEQRLGPVDGVVTDAASAATVQAVFGPDLVRRGHGAVLVVDDLAVDSVISALLGTP
jgi:NAD(P)-dependent dehydrogenase (short-subunit alcohol dehydrogenase family)